MKHNDTADAVQAELEHLIRLATVLHDGRLVGGVPGQPASAHQVAAQVRSMGESVARLAAWTEVR